MKIKHIITVVSEVNPADYDPPATSVEDAAKLEQALCDQGLIDPYDLIGFGAVTIKVEAAE